MILLDDECRALEKVSLVKQDPSYQEDPKKLQESIEIDRKIAKELNEELAKFLIGCTNG